MIQRILLLPSTDVLKCKDGPEILRSLGCIRVNVGPGYTPSPFWLRDKVNTKTLSLFFFDSLAEVPLRLTSALSTRNPPQDSDVTSYHHDTSDESSRAELWCY